MEGWDMSAPQKNARGAARAGSSVESVAEGGAVGDRLRGKPHHHVLGDELVGPVVLVGDIAAPQGGGPAAIQGFDAGAQIEGGEGVDLGEVGIAEGGVG